MVTTTMPTTYTTEELAASRAANAAYLAAQPPPNYTGYYILGGIAVACIILAGIIAGITKYRKMW